MARRRWARRCRAHCRDGQPCRAYAIVGGVVCRKHGGAAPQVRRAAARRFEYDRATRQLHSRVARLQAGNLLDAIDDYRRRYRTFWKEPEDTIADEDDFIAYYLRLTPQFVACSRYLGRRKTRVLLTKEYAKQNARTDVFIEQVMKGWRRRRR